MAHVVRFALQRERDEEAVGAVRLRLSGRLAVDGNDPASLLAGALGDELLQPGAERREVLAEQEGELVGALLRQPRRDAADAAGDVLGQPDAGMGRQRD